MQDDRGRVHQLLNEAVRQFWQTRGLAGEQGANTGDRGSRSEVTGGRHLDAMLELIKKVVVDAGAAPAEIHIGRSVPVLPGFFRPTKEWDLVITHRGSLAAAIELKAQVGPSFGNNFNNRAEEALGSALDIWTAFRQGAFGDHPAPWVGYFFVLEDHDVARRPVRITAPLFPVSPEFHGSSYARRYEILLRRMVRERHYSSAALLMTPNPGDGRATFHEPAADLSATTWLRSLVSHLSGLP